MKLVLALGALAWVGCGGDSGGGEAKSDTSGTATADTTAVGDAPAPGCEYASLFAASACNPLCATGCDAGKVCTLSSGDLACVESGTQPLRKGCNDVSTCAEGACASVGTGSSKCRPFCTKTIECEEGEICGNEVALASGDKAMFCIPKPPACSLFAQDCEKPEDACYLEQNGNYCAKAGTKLLGAECAGPSECKANLICVSDKCHQPCSLKSGGSDPKCNVICDYGSGEVEKNVLGVCTLLEKDECKLWGGTCDGGKVCIFDGNHTKCGTAGSTAAGGACTSGDDCAAGTTCYADKCYALCDPNSGPPHNECKEPLSNCPKLPGTNAGYCDE